MVGLAASVSVWSIGADFNSNYSDGTQVTDRGTWSATATYNLNDTVTVGGVAYVARNPIPAGGLSPASDPANWRRFDWQSTTTYAKNDLVISSTADTYFYSLVDGNTGNTPESSPASWTGVGISKLTSIRRQLTTNAPGFCSLISIKLTGTETAGGRIFYTIRATDGGSQIATEQGVMQYLATANSVTCTVDTTDKLHLGTVNSGSTPGFFNPGSQPGVSIFDNVSFSSPAPIIVNEVTFRILNVSGAKLRLEP